ncbi:MAG: type II toxin-antitoxin system RelE/ParE family toxin [Sedimenticola sp.]
MADFLVLKSAGFRLQEIFNYTRENWGEEQARDYIEGMFERFAQIAAREVIWHPIPAEFEVNGYFTVYEKHYIYWKELSSGQVGIVTVLHERMHQMERFAADLTGSFTEKRND